MDVLSIEKTNENFRVLLDTRGRFILKTLKPEEAKFKLCKVVAKKIGANKIPYIVTHDGRTIRYPHPEINVYDTVKFDL
jgi:small subunit ribosomal protein S4e